MQYREDRDGEKLSVLGYGCMRFSRKGSAVDLEKTEKEILRAVDQGVNYFDTAYIYPGSEQALGTIVEKNGLRDRINIATKLPQYLITSASAIDKYFDEQLRRLKTDLIDYYLMHMLTDTEAWNKLSALGIREWIEKQKSAGRIRKIGFSYHGGTDMFLQILNAYDWDFCQIQYNYMDENSQAGRRGLQAAYAKGIPVIIMEGLRGGKLVSMLPEKARALIAADPKGRTAAELAFRWLWDQKEVTCVLSGMNSEAMVEENCRVASECRVGEFDDSDRALIEGIRTAISAAMRIMCTGCAYCMPCPKNVDIPAAFRCWNEMYTEKKSTGRHEYFQTVGLRLKPAFASQCVACGRCAKHCPQHLDIPAALRQADRELRPLPYRAASAVARKFIFRRKSRS